MRHRRGGGGTLQASSNPASSGETRRCAPEAEDVPLATLAAACVRQLVGGLGRGTACLVCLAVALALMSAAGTSLRHTAAPATRQSHSTPADTTSTTTTTDPRCTIPTPGGLPPAALVSEFRRSCMTPSRLSACVAPRLMLLPPGAPRLPAAGGAWVAWAGHPAAAAALLLRRHLGTPGVPATPQQAGAALTPATAAGWWVEGPAGALGGAALAAATAALNATCGERCAAGGAQRAWLFPKGTGFPPESGAAPFFLFVLQGALRVVVYRRALAFSAPLSADAGRWFGEDLPRVARSGNAGQACRIEAGAALWVPRGFGFAVLAEEEGVTAALQLEVGMR